MRSSQSTVRRIVLVAMTVAVAAAWFTWLRPATLGGDVSYIVVDGSSMEPTYADGDLVLVRKEAEYTHGDVIAFHAGGVFDDPTRIIHRIVGDAPDGKFRTQGDNRDRIDPWQPGPENVIGKAVFHVPRAGTAAGVMTRPSTIALLGGLAVVFGGRRRRRRRQTAGLEEVAEPARTPAIDTVLPDPPPPRARKEAGGTAERDLPSGWSRHTHPRWAFVGLVVSALLAGPVLALAWSALRAPDSNQRIERVGQVDYGIGFGYRFAGPPSAVYPAGVVTSTRAEDGQVVPDGPLYSRLLDRLEIDLGFRLTADGAERVTATYAVEVHVKTPGGWSAPLEGIDTGRVDRTASETLAIDLPSVAYRVAEVAALTGVGGDAHTIHVTPRLDVTGGADGVAIDDRLTAPMSFTLGGNLITAEGTEDSGSQELTRTVTERARFGLGPFELGTQAARGVLSGLALVLVGGIVWFASVLFAGMGLREPERIAARYRSRIVDVTAASAPPGPVVMVGGIDELVRIAKAEQSVILHEDLGDGAHRYRVFLGTVAYEYEAAPEHAGAAAEAEASPTADGPGG